MVNDMKKSKDIAKNPKETKRSKDVLVKGSILFAASSLLLFF